MTYTNELKKEPHSGLSDLTVGLEVDDFAAGQTEFDRWMTKLLAIHVCEMKFEITSAMEQLNSEDWRIHYEGGTSPADALREELALCL